MASEECAFVFLAEWQLVLRVHRVHAVLGLPRGRLSNLVFGFMLLYMFLMFKFKCSLFGANSYKNVYCKIIYFVYNGIMHFPIGILYQDF